mmetsp:Transcript_38976/g.43917  ORF Transcript_38976/g.43917 Transcript_38976/m.43917 type:complete len:91 (-) Transcript_38976:112-384(-)
MVGISRSVISSISTTVFARALVVVAIEIVDRIPLPRLLLVFCGEKANTSPPNKQQNKHTNTDNDNEITADNWNFILLCYRMVYYDCYTLY